MKSTSIKVTVECNSRVKLQCPPVSKPSLKATTTTAQSWMKRWNMEEEERSPPTQRPRMHRRAPTLSNPWHTRDLHARHHSLLVKRKGWGASLGLPLHRLGILHGYYVIMLYWTMISSSLTHRQSNDTESSHAPPKLWSSGTDSHLQLLDPCGENSLPSPFSFFLH